MNDFFRHGRHGRPKKRAALASDKLDVRCAPPPPIQGNISNKPKKDNAASVATTAKYMGVIPRKNYFVGDDKVNIEIQCQNGFQILGFLDSNW